jgi:PAS domain S-box-containing protein
VYVSPASRSVYGYEPEAMVGRFGWEFLHPDDLAAMTTDFSDRADEPDVVTSCYRVLRGDGDYVWVEARIRTLRDPQTGEVVEFHTIARDVGERQRAEAELHRAQEEAERANAAKSEFLSRMSHELRTPLHAILGFGDLLARDDLRPAQCEQLGQITKAGRHLLELINEVLDLSRIEDGGLSMSLEPVHVGQVLSETLEMLAPLAAARAVTLAPARHAAEDLHVVADRQRLKQVLLNLLSNAVKYNRTGGEAWVATTLAAPATARIEVADTGIGIAPGDLAAAFAPFERLAAETTEVEGTGLGLALAKRLVEAMGGTIGVDSEIGRGTTFWMQLPAVAAPAVRPAERAPPATPATRLRSPARTILYIEDNPSNIKLVEAMLGQRPEVMLLVAQQGSLGLELAREHVPALVLLDVNLPDIPGDEVLRRLRGDARTADVAVVMVSADATPGQVARLRKAGADGYLTKPFELDEFLAIVDDAAAPHPPRPPTPAPAADEPLDLSLLDRVRGLYPDGRRVKELVELYLDDSPGRLDELVAAAVADDAEGVRRAAHAWRGSCSVTGARLLAALLDEVEIGARDGAVPSSRRLDAIRRSFEEARAALMERYP